MAFPRSIRLRTEDAWILPALISVIAFVAAGLSAAGVILPHPGDAFTMSMSGYNLLLALLTEAALMFVIHSEHIAPRPRCTLCKLHPLIATLSVLWGIAGFVMGITRGRVDIEEYTTKRYTNLTAVLLANRIVFYLNAVFFVVYWACLMAIMIHRRELQRVHRNDIQGLALQPLPFRHSDPEVASSGIRPSSDAVESTDITDATTQDPPRNAAHIKASDPYNPLRMNPPDSNPANAVKQNAEDRTRQILAYDPSKCTCHTQGNMDIDAILPVCPICEPKQIEDITDAAKF